MAKVLRRVRKIRGTNRKVVLLGTGKRLRVTGFRNTTDRTTSKSKRTKRVRGFVNNPDVSKRGRTAKNFRRSRR